MASPGENRELRILFLCPESAPGQSGVGDYAWRLAAECRRQGAQAQVVSLCEQGTATGAEAGAHPDGAQAPGRQMPASWSWRRKAGELRELVNQWRPDWISLQFVPFGYHRKGLALGLTEMLKSIRGSHRWHVMFHEVWVGAFVGAGCKLRLLGAVQKEIVRRLLRILRPSVIHTQALPHVSLLAGLGCKAEHLPLFGNIPFAPDGCAAGRRLIFEGPPLVGAFPHMDEPEPAWLIGGMFGAVHPEWRPEPFFSQWIEAAQATARPPLLVFLGRHGRSQEFLHRLAAGYAGQITVRILESLPETQVSQVLQALDFGMVSTPWQLREKSGSLAAMADHGLPAVITRDDWQLRSPAPSNNRSDRSHPLCLPPGTSSQELLSGLRREVPSPRLPRVAAQFLNALYAHSHAR